MSASTAGAVVLLGTLPSRFPAPSLPKEVPWDQWNELFMAALTPKFQANAFKVLGVGHARLDGVWRDVVIVEKLLPAASHEGQS